MWNSFSSFLSCPKRFRTPWSTFEEKKEIREIVLFDLYSLEKEILVSIFRYTMLEDDWHQWYYANDFRACGHKMKDFLNHEPSFSIWKIVFAPFRANPANLLINPARQSYGFWVLRKVGLLVEDNMRSRSELDCRVTQTECKYETTWKISRTRKRILSIRVLVEASTLTRQMIQTFFYKNHINIFVPRDF